MTTNNRGVVMDEALAALSTKDRWVAHRLLRRGYTFLNWNRESGIIWLYLPPNGYAKDWSQLERFEQQAETFRYKLEMSNDQVS